MAKNNSTPTHVGMEESFANFNSIIPRTIFSEADPELLDKKGQTFTGLGTGAMGAGMGFGNLPNMMGGPGGGNIMRNPSRRFYDPEITTTAIFLPRTVKQKNRWRRWFYDHDEMVGAVLDIHAELPYSRAEIVCDDPSIRNHVEECFDKTKFFSMLPLIDLEFMKIGEVFIHTPWDNKLGMWNHIIIHNPDYIEVKYSPFADQECVLELIPDEELRSLVHTTKPEEQHLKKRLPSEIVRRVLTGKNIILDSGEVTHIARRSNSYDIRGTSIIDRLFRCFVPNTKVRMSDGSCKVIEDIKVGDQVISKNAETRKVIDVVNYDVNTTLIELTINKRKNTLKTTEGHKYLIKRDYCSCGCGIRLNYSQIKKGVKFHKGHFLKIANKVSSSERINFSSDSITKIMKLGSEEIEIGDKLLIPISNDVVPTTLNEDKARLLGYYLAEGSFSGSKYRRLCFSLNIDETETIAKDIINIIEKEFNIKAVVNKDRGNGIRVIVYKTKDNEILYDFIKKYTKGDRSWNKEIIDDFMLYPKEIQMNLLIGEFRGDGWYSKEDINEVRCCTVSKKLADQLSWLLFRNKYFNDIRILKERKNIKILNNFSNARESYHIYLTGNFAKNFVSKCWNVEKFYSFMEDQSIYNSIKELRCKNTSLKKIAKNLNKLGCSCLYGKKFYASTIKTIIKNEGYGVTYYTYNLDFIDVDDNYFYVPVIKINKIPYKGKVYDITVDINHWWLADGAIVTSNTLMYDDKLRESQMTISDNFIYPLKLFKLGDPNRGWIPSSDHQRALAQMLQQAQFDPNFSLIYHYALQVEYITVADRIMRLDKEFEQITERKMIALGVSKEFIAGGGSYSSANVGLQVQLSRYKAKRDLFEVRWIRDKFLRIMAEKNEWYKRDAREIVGHYRVKRKGEELKRRLIMPELIWHKKLMMRDDQSFLTFLHNVYAQGKGPVSGITLMLGMGMDLEDELKKKKYQKLIEQQVGEYITPPVTGLPGGGLSGLTAKIKDKLRFGKPKLIDESGNELLYGASEFTGKADIVNPLADPTALAESLKEGQTKAFSAEQIASNETLRYIVPSNDQEWQSNLRSPSIPIEVVNLLNSLDIKLGSINKKYNGNFVVGITEEMPELSKSLISLYIQGKLSSYNVTNYFPVSRSYLDHVASSGPKDYSDILMASEFEEWIEDLTKIGLDKDLSLRHIRNLGNTCYSYGQLKGFQEQGIHNVRISNVFENEGLRYKVNDLLSKGKNLGSLISPNDEIIILMPCIAGFDEDDNNVDSHIQRFKNFSVNGITIKSCPIEYVNTISRCLEKLGKFVKTKYSMIEFVNDVIEIPEWEEKTKIAMEAKYKDLDEVMIANLVNVERSRKIGNIPSFNSGKTLYIASWIGREERPLLENLITYLDIYDENLEKSIGKAFKTANFDLSKDDITTYQALGIILPIEENGTVHGWIAKEGTISDERINTGKKWDSAGRCIVGVSAEPMEIFKDNLRLWVDYPHRLNKNIKSMFENL